MVFVLDSNNNSLTPTSNSNARRLLSSNKALVYKVYPFIIKLKKSFNSTKSFSIKIDPGSSISGISIVDQDKALFFFELIHRGKEIKKALFQRRNIRRSRRNRKTRYRKCRFLNRKRKTNWLAPSVKSRADNILNFVKKYSKYIKIDRIIIERVSFNTSQLSSDDKLFGLDYQSGNLKDIKLRKFIFQKYNNCCVYCNGESKDSKLEVEHLVSKANGGTNSTHNLVLSCRTCNELKSTLSLKDFGKLMKKDFTTQSEQALLVRKLEPKKLPKEAAIVQSARNYVINSLKENYIVETGEGWETKINREENNLPKEHYYDALSVGEDKNYRIVTDKVLIIKAVGRGTRQMCRVDKYGFPRTTATQSEQAKLVRKENRVVKGFMTGDIVRAVVNKGIKKGKYFGKVAIRSNGYFNITTSNGIIQGIGYKDCKVIQKSDGYNYNIKGVSKFPTNLNDGVSFAKN